MNKCVRRGLHSAIAAVVLLSACVDQSAKEPGPGRSAPDIAEQVGALHEAGAVRRVVAVLNVDPQVPGALEEAVGRVQTALGTAGRITRRYEALPLLALSLSDSALRRLTALPDILEVQEDHALEVIGKTAAAAGGSASAAVSAKAAWNLGWGGQGVRVAVVDSGIDAGHPDLAGKVVAQKCFSTDGCPPYGAPEGDAAPDPHGHGTHVASIIAGAGKVAPAGVAPNAELVAVRVFGPSGAGTDSDALAGVDWALSQSGKLAIRAVNLSLGGQSGYTGPCDKAVPAWAVAAKVAAKKGVALFAASGNSGFTAALGAPACVSGLTSVGATYLSNALAKVWPGLCSDSPQKAGAVTCFSNRSKLLTLVAPGSPVLGAKAGGKTTVMSGTSQATPAAVGVAALLWSCNPKLTPAQIVSALKTTGVMTAVTPPGVLVPRVDAAAAIAACQKL